MCVATDLIPILRALRGNPSFQTIAIVLRLSSFFRFDEVRKWAVSALEAMWPGSYDAITCENKPYAAESLILARFFNIASIVPHAMYELVRSTDTDDWEKVSYAYYHIRSNASVVQRELKLSPQDLLLLHELRTLFLSFRRGLLERPPNGIHMACMSASKWNSTIQSNFITECTYDPLICTALLCGLKLPWCTPAKFRRGSIVDNWGRGMLLSGLKPPEAREIIRRTSVAWWNMGLCDNCVKTMENTAVACRRRLWEAVLTKVGKAKVCGPSTRDVELQAPPRNLTGVVVRGQNQSC